MNLTRIIMLAASLSIVAVSIFGTVKMSPVFANDMMFQRNKPIKIWGEADKGETIEIRFMDETVKTKANKQGRWEAYLKPKTEGGPYELTVKGKQNLIEINNILIGDLWFCSGQSNMEMTVNGWAQVDNYVKEITEANYPEIRTFNTEKAINTVPQSDVMGQWLTCSPATVSDFSATAYFFARELYKELNIPIGIVNSSWGGTQIEPWISVDAYSKLANKFMEKYSELDIKDFDAFMKKNSLNQEAYLNALNNDPAMAENWQTDIPVADWKIVRIPQAWSENELSEVDGYVWFKYVVNLPQSVEGKSAEISLGCIDDNDITWINGSKVGETRGYNVDRKYVVPSNLLKAGDNTITVRVHDESGGGGIYSNEDQLYITVGGEKHSIAGNWLYKPSVINTQYNYVALTSNSYPSLLYNGMIHPFLNIPIKGVIWYQGESNTNNFKEAYDYRTLFPTLINDWRMKWNNPKLPFYWVQLTNFKAKDDVPSDNEWAVLREAQDMTLSLPYTGQAVTIDIGDANDIHPRNKQDVGLRLALIALNKDYGKDNNYVGPRYKKHEIKGNKIIITLDNVDDGIIIKNKYEYIEGFAVAGMDKKFYWAKAYLEDGNIIVHSDKVKSPIAVRYGWSSNPDINVFNTTGLPLGAFRTDDWNGITKKY